jgi:signal transduction histidine kinase
MSDADPVPVPEPPGGRAQRAGAVRVRGPGWRGLWRRGIWPGGLSSRLLVLTVLFVVLAELLILGPSLAGFHEGRLTDRVRAAELASLAVEAAPDQMVTETMSGQLLAGAGVVSVAVQSDGIRRLLLQGPRMERTPDLVDLRHRNLVAWLAEPFRTMFARPDRMVRVVAAPRFRDGDFVEIVVPNAPLKADLADNLLDLLGVTVFVSAVVGGLVYLALSVFLVRPIRRITLAMERFRADPTNPASRVEQSLRRDEIGRAEAELDRMQADLLAALNSRARLAALGEAVAKINHDLRNILTSAQVASERLAQSGALTKDPGVARAMPRLERALDRAVALASNVLTYGKSAELAPQSAPTPLRAAVEAAAEDAGLGEDGVILQADIAEDVEIQADPEQLHRILVNLMRNGRQAIEAQPGRETPGRIRVSASRDDGAWRLTVADNGPGVPERAVERLFQPFSGSSRPDGAGLGLAIARELAHGHGGDLVLARNGPDGAVFELRLPARD